MTKKTNFSGTLYRLIYCSRNVIQQGSREENQNDTIRAILSTARGNNKANNVTGALLLTSSGFAQVLEGARYIVERTFELICADPRHSDVTVLSFTPAERRSFPDWAMGFSGPVSLDGVDPLASLLGISSAAGPRATTASDVLRLMEKLIQREDEPVAA